MPHNERSSTVTAGAHRSPNRAMLRAVGFQDDDFEKPIVGIANGYSNLTPCNLGLAILTRRAEVALQSAGCMHQTFGTITVSDGISMGTEGMKYSLVSREVIADSIETVVGCAGMDGYVAIGGCDKNMPGCLITMARMNRPAVFVYGGTILPGCLTAATSPNKGKELDVVSVFEAIGQHAAVAEKIRRIKVPDLEVHGDPDGLLVVGWGSTFGPIGAAVRRVRAEGIPVAEAHLRHLNPFPKNLGEVLRRYDKVVIPEMNLGQLALLIRGRYLVDAIPYNQVRGLPFKAEELAGVIKDVIASV